MSLDLGYIVFGLLIAATPAAWLADRKGRNFWVVLIFGLVTATGVLLIPYFLLVRPMGLGSPEPRAATADGSADDRITLLEQITALRSAGTLTQDEFDAEKARILQA